MKKTPVSITTEYDVLLTSLSTLLESARSNTVRSVNSIITHTYWEVGKRIIEHEQQGQKRASYGKVLMHRLSKDLSSRFGRGFSIANLEYMRRFYSLWSIPQPVAGELTEANSLILQQNTIQQPLSAESKCSFPLPWSHYVQLLSVEKQAARGFYEQEAVRGGWSKRQLIRQIDSQFYERTLLSKNKAAMLRQGQKPAAHDSLTAEEELKDPCVLEFLGLKDEYSETDLEDALINQLETFLLELGGDFTFVGRQKRLRIDDEWYRVDLVLYHRRLRCLVIVDLKLGRLGHADIGQMHLYLNYAKAQWTYPDENPPVGLILCTSKGQMFARYALEGLPNKVLAREYRMTLPDESTLVAELEKRRKLFECQS